jgi:hypothetical protein
MTIATLGRVLLHTCPRCRGDLFADTDTGSYSCLQCGREFPEAFVRVMGTGAEATHPIRHLRLVPAAEQEWNDDAA